MNRQLYSSNNNGVVYSGMIKSCCGNLLTKIIVSLTAEKLPVFTITRKMSLFLLIITLAMASCNGGDNIVTNMPPSGEAQKDSVRSLFKAFNAHDWQRFASFYKDTAEFLDPEFGQEYVKKTRQETISKYSEMTQMFPGLKDSITNIFADGESVVAEFISSGSSPDSSTWKLPIVTVFTFKEGKIARDATYYDIAMPEPPIQ